MIHMRTYDPQPGYTPDYEAVRAFLVRRGVCEFTYARWDWMITHPNLDPSRLGDIGLWEEDGVLVAAALFDCRPGETFLITLPGYEKLKPKMLAFARNRQQSGEGRLRLVIPDTDRAFQSLAAQAGYTASQEREWDYAFYPEETSSAYTLPEGFTLTDMRERLDIHQYNRVLWKGFNHEINGEGPYDPARYDDQETLAQFIRPHAELSWKIAAVAPDGAFAAYCGMWYDKEAGFAVIEPVATDPDCRLLGLGRAVVLEGIRRVADAGAPLVLVGSSQRFYARIGLRPFASATYWEEAGR